MKNLQKAKDVLKDYFDIVVPDNILVSIISSNNLRHEVETGGITDTCQRSVLINAVVRHYGFANWPTYGDAVNIDEFHAKLNAAIASSASETVYVLMADADGTTRSVDRPIGVAVRTEEEAKRFVKEGKF